MKIFKLISLREYSLFFWIILISILGILTSTIYSKNKDDQLEKIESTLENIYLKKILKEITENLEPRFTTMDYKTTTGDTHQSIINNLEINKKEKKLLLDTILKNKSLKILKVNQKFIFKFDNLLDEKVIEFRIEKDKKNEIIFKKDLSSNTFVSREIEKNFEKKLVYKETIITNSLYNSALNLGIKPNIIIEFARLYGFQVDFQRDIWKNDSFQIIYEEFINENNKVVDTGEIIFANLNLQNTDLQLYKYEYEKNKIDYFDENGKVLEKP